MLIHDLELPKLLNLSRKKSWQVGHLIDTLEMWKFGDYKHYTSLELLTNVLGIPSPKGDISGNEVAKVYYKDQDLNRIVRYCERDVMAMAQVYLRFMNITVSTGDQA